MHRRHRFPNAAAAPHLQHAVQGARNTLANIDLPLLVILRDDARVDACMFVEVCCYEELELFLGRSCSDDCVLIEQDDKVFKYLFPLR